MSYLHRFAAISDIHGNAWALDAVLADINDREITLTVNLGDHFYGPLEPLQTFERLNGLNLPSICGNCDRLLVDGSDASQGSTLLANRGQLKPKHRQWIRALSPVLLWNKVVLCHGTPTHDDACLLETVDSSGVRAASPSEVRARLRQCENRTSLVLCGHSHVPRTFLLPKGPLIVNVGSVGLPAYTDDAPFPHAMETGSPHARYAILSMLSSGWNVEHVEVTYNYKRAAECAERNGRSDWAVWLRTGCARHLR
jgi:predicted phosphodiesterase